MSSAKKILVIDDEKSICQNCIKILSPEGFTVFSVFNGNEFLKLNAEHNFDIILLDLRLPDMNGLDLLKNIKERDPQSKVVIITGYPTLESSMEALRRGASDYIIKPFTPDELLESITNGLSTQKPNKKSADEDST